MTCRHPLCCAVLAAATIALTATATPAAARSATTSASSSNWSGYAVHASGVRYRTVTADWRQPRGRCTTRSATYSSIWVGLGGYSGDSDALEQIGTELDCSPGDGVRSSAWFELVPAASRSIAMTVRSGDRMSASVTVRGDRVTLVLSDISRGERFARTFVDHDIDVGSAEWIVEAPSQCVDDRCTVLPLADFRRVTFLAARVEATSGPRYSLADDPWSTTRIVLGSTFVSGDGDGEAVQTDVSASPLAVSGDRGGFAVVYRARTTSATGGGAPSTGGAPGSGGPGGGPARRR